MQMKWWLAVGVVLAGSLAWAQGRGGMSARAAWMKVQEKLSPVQEYSVTMVMEAEGQAMTSKMFKAGKKVRMEVSMQGMQAITLVDPEADGGKGASYMLMPMMKTYMKTPLPPEAAAKADDDKADVKIDELGKEDVDGVSCVKRRVTVTVTTDGKAVTMTMWSSPKAKDMPVKVSMTEPAAMTILFKDYDFTKPAADLFTIPADYKANDFGGMMRQP